MSELRRRKEEYGGQGEEQLVRDLSFFKGAMSTWAIYFGHVNYSVVVHNTSKIIMIPVESGLVIVTTNESYPLRDVERISTIVKEQLLALSKT